MDGLRMSFLSSWWLLLIAAPGLWLAFRLYLRKDAPGLPARKARRVLASLTAVAWLLLALFAIAPRWSSRPEIWHPPSVVLALDVSPSYGAAGLHDSAIAAMRAARAHYEARGFRVVETGFSERATASLKHVPAAGTLTFLASLRRHLDTASPPHLQAVFLWTDGRFHDAADEEGAAWPVPVYPVMQGQDFGEVQGESAAADFTTPGGATLAVTWRSLDDSRARDAALEVHAGGKLLWKAALPHPPAARAGSALMTRLPIPAHVQARAMTQGVEDVAADTWVLLVRPHAGAANATGKNDTVPITVRTRNVPLHIFFRPLASLEERGLLDVLRSSDTWGVSADPLDARRMSRRDVVWIPASVSPQRKAAVASAILRAAQDGAPVVVYEFAGTAQGDRRFASDARLERRTEGAEFLPPGALRLADLGMADAALRAPDSALEPLAWAMQDGRRGLLFWRHRDDGTFGVALPSLWRARFESGARTQAGDWVRGVAAWVMARRFAHGGARVKASEPVPARDPLDVEMARLGVDVEGLDRLAARHDGKVLSASGHDSVEEFSWPGLPEGQLRESRARSLVLTPPFATALLIALTLAGIWILRRRLRLD